MSEVVLEANGLALGYDGADVLHDVDLRVRAGEVWFVVGPNGAGKSTLLRAVVGVLAPRSGRLVRHPALAARERMGFVPQRADLNPTLPTTVREFVRLGTVGTRLPAREESARVAAALERVGLADGARRDLWSLSGGERHHRALVRRPSLLVLDEPTNHLDPGAEDSLLRLLMDLNATERLTLLVVTHDLALAARYATHVALVERGTVTAGPRDAVLGGDRLARAFGLPAGAAS
jgi:ABC-type Mn2+/Zn2+ transport system ATPase subunit